MLLWLGRGLGLALGHVVLFSLVLCCFTLLYFTLLYFTFSLSLPLLPFLQR